MENALVPGRLPCALRGLLILTPTPSTADLIPSLQLRLAWPELPVLAIARSVLFYTWLLSHLPDVSETSLCGCTCLWSVART